ARWLEECLESAGTFERIEEMLSMLFKKLRANALSLSVLFLLTCPFTFISRAPETSYLKVSQIEKNVLSELIAKLSSPNQSTRREAQKQLIGLARRSSEMRIQLVSKLIGLLDNRESSFEARAVAANMLGELRAGEAINA